MPYLQKLNIPMMRDALVKADGGEKRRWLFSGGLGIVLDAVGVLAPFVRDGRGGPYLIEDYRLALCRKGRLRAVVNLREIEVGEGTILVVAPGSVVEPIEMSPDFTVTGVGVTLERMRLAHPQGLPAAVDGRRRTAVLRVTEEERALLSRLFGTMWHLARGRNTGSGTLDNMLGVITAAYGDILRVRERESALAGDGDSRRYAMFQHFITLVNEHCREQRRLDYYAGRLCVTARYLGAVVHGVSGVTAKEWVDRAVLTAAKVELRHTDKPVARIADELRFPSDAFFCKFFRRMAGCTPLAWRKGGHA